MGKTGALPTALTAVAAVGCMALSASPALAGDVPSPNPTAAGAPPVNADQDGNPIPQAPADANVPLPRLVRPNAPQGCPPDPGYAFSNVKSTFVGDPSKTVYGASGVTLTLSVASGHTWTGTIGGSIKGEVSAIVAGAEASINASISYAKTTTVTLGGSWTVPANMADGWLALGSKGYSFHWEYGSTNGACKWIVSRSGNAKLPAMSPYIAHS